MKNINKFKLIIFSFLILCSCNKNILSSESSLDTDEQYYSDALTALNNQSFDQAISIITQQMSVSYQSTSQVRQLLASGYAGKCGLNFIDYTNRLSQSSSGSALRVMMDPFVQREVHPSFCKQALEAMELIGPTESRTINQNTFVSVLGMVLLGTSLRDSTDQSPSLGDGSADVNICLNVTNSQIDDMIVGFGHFSKNFSSVSQATIGFYSSSVLAGITSTCQTVSGQNCQITDASLITPTLRTAFRDIVNTEEFGVGSFITGGNQLLVVNACP